MRARLAVPLALALAGGALTACTSTTSSSVAPSSGKCGITATNSTSSFGASGGSGTVSVSTARDCTWSVATSSGWVSLSGASNGQGDGVVAFSVSPNPVPAPRSASITVGSEAVPVNQAGASCTFTLSAATGSIAAAGGPLSVAVSTLSGCSWSARSNAAWIALASGASGNGSGTVGLSIGANSGAARTGTVTIGGQTYTLTQTAEDAPPPPTTNPPPPPPPPPPPIGVPVDFTGSVNNINGTCPNLTFTVGLFTVQTGGSTKFKGISCGDLAKLANNEQDKHDNTVNVEVTGTLQTNGVVAADQVTLTKG